MPKIRNTISCILGAAAAATVATAAHATDFNVPGGLLETALDAYSQQSGVHLLVPSDEMRGVRTRGVKGDLASTTALSRILAGTGFSAKQDNSGVMGIVRATRPETKTNMLETAPLRVAAAASAVESVVVTSSKIKGDIQTVPIAITALSQEQLTSRQIAGGPDLIKEVPNLTFTKTNFTGYSIQIRGIGTQAISVTTDPAVAVAFNDTPFIRNHFFEQEFYDIGQVEVLRGPQGTLYGRNATAGVVNVVSAKPTDQYEAQASVDIGNYQNRRLEGMVNIPIFGDRLDIRAAGEWTKRDGYSFNATTDKPIDGRDLWSTRLTIGFKPMERLQAYLIWEHFSENDDRVRSAKQLCKKDMGPETVAGLDITHLANTEQSLLNQSNFWRSFLSQACLPASFYSPQAYETPNGEAIPFIFALTDAFNGSAGGAPDGFLLPQIDPYVSQTQSRDLRVIESDLSPTYAAKNDVFELNADFAITSELTLSSQTAYSKDELRSTEDFNRFNTRANLFPPDVDSPRPRFLNGVYCDPQLGCSTKFVAEDLSREHAWQFSQELRLASNFEGRFNFSLGANYLHYQTVEDYFVFANLLTLLTQVFNGQAANNFTIDLNGRTVPDVPYFDPVTGLAHQSYGGCCDDELRGTYIDPNPIESINGDGHNYFRSQNPYRLNSYAGFGEAYYQLTPEVKLTGGVRWTDDRKLFTNIPSWTFLVGGGYPELGTVAQEWKKLTGRFNVNWTPKLDFTDQTMVYASYSRGYKGGGANPPPPVLQSNGLAGTSGIAVHPATFEPEFVNAFELGTKNGLLDGSLTLNADVFYYDYKAYQISQIVDRTSINLNFDATVKGAEFESTWEPMPGLRFNMAAGFEDSSVNKGQSAIDLMDRTAGNSDWLVIKPFISETSNCVYPADVIRAVIESSEANGGAGFLFGLLCDLAYNPSVAAAFGADPKTFIKNFTGVDYNPATAPNGGAGFAKDVGSNELPNTPHFTMSLGGQYTVPLSENWAATLRSDFYWQSQSYARIFNDRPYDKLRGYSTANLALILTNVDGWEAMAYVKNVFDKTAITGAFLNSDDTGLTTNVFLTDPRLFGLRITKTL